MPNRTYEEKIVQKLSAPATTSGCHLVVYRENRGGRSLYRVLPPGAPFRLPLKDRWGTYSAYAVTASPALRYRFSRQHHVGAGEERDEFTLKVVVAYRIAQPEVVVEAIERDPLGSLEAAVSDALERRAAALTYRELVDSEFDMESFVLEVGPYTPVSGAPSAEEELEDAFSDLGFELLRVRLVRIHSSGVIEAGKEIAAGERTTTVEKRRIGWKADLAKATGIAKADVEAVEVGLERALTEARAEVEYLKQIEANRVAGLKHGAALLTTVTESLRTALGNVAADTRTARELSEAVHEIVEARSEIEASLRSQAPLPGAANMADGIFSQIGGGGAEVPLIRELRRLIEEVGKLDGDSTTKAGVAGRILHVLGEASLDGFSSSERLDDYVTDLSEYCEEIELHNRLVDEAQMSYFRRFQRIAELRAELAEPWR